MRKGYHPRKEKFRKPKRKVVIVCEGKKTEINYFNGLKTRNSGVKIIAVHGGTHPKHIVEYAEERIGKKWSIDFDEGDGVWCAFDVDDNTNQNLKEAYDLAKAKNIQIALSNPCFELWFFLHYKLITSTVPRGDIYKDLKTFIKDYEKNKKINDLLKDKLPTAIKNAERLNIIHERRGTHLASRKSNPSTQVFKLIEFIRQLTEKNKAKGN